MDKEGICISGRAYLTARGRPNSGQEGVFGAPALKDTFCICAMESWSEEVASCVYIGDVNLK